MRGWLADFFRSLGAPWYWNVRKQLFALRGRTGACPCHNPSDSGRAMETRCEAVAYWHEPRRFAQRVCPLLKQNETGDWRCSAEPQEVRPFWLRSFALLGGTTACALVLLGVLLWGTMRSVGFDVQLRQILWPPAWHELRTVRAAFFRAQAEEHLRAAKFREALASLQMASGLAPQDYDIGMLLAQVHHLTRPELADQVYRRLYDLHPGRRAETARVWYRSLLARGELTGIGELARVRLEEGGPDMMVWLHGLLLSARWDRNWEKLASLAADVRVPAAARDILAFELRLRTTDAVTAQRLLRMEPIGREPYALLHRLERLLEFNEPLEALLLLQESRAGLGDRDRVRLTLAALAVAGHAPRLEREVRALLDRPGTEGMAAVMIVSQHLVRYPDLRLLNVVHDAWRRLAGTTEQSEREAVAALLCAAAVAGRLEWIEELRAELEPASTSAALAPQRFHEVFRRAPDAPLVLLGVVRPLSVDLNYAVLERALALH